MLSIYRNILTRPRIWVIAWLTWFAVLWVLSSRAPNLDQFPLIPHIDKIIHFGYFFGGAGLIYIPIHHHFNKHSSLSRIALCTGIGVAIGALDEFHQSFVPGRFGNDLGDLVADGFGSLVGALVMAKIINALLPSVTA